MLLVTGTAEAAGHAARKGLISPDSRKLAEFG
jgi:hypothetical protein